MPTVVKYTNPNKLADVTQTQIEVALDRAFTALSRQDCRCHVLSYRHSAKSSKLEIKVEFGLSRKPVAILPDKVRLDRPKS